MDIGEYEEKYEKVNPTTNHLDNDQDVLGEVLDETLNELCEPEMNRKRKSSGDLQQSSKYLKPSTSENKELESQIEFSDSSDDED